jgi:(E)-4-hydroxy-3-methylbut-2-enyl-diphosphate synthase
MANVPTLDTEAAVSQAIRMIEAGAEYVRFTARGEREARNLACIRQRLTEQGYTTPLVADIHFNPEIADTAARLVEKVRINPGNYADKVKAFNATECTDEEYAAGLRKIRERLVSFLRICKEHGTAVRIGVNHGSLSDRIMGRYGDTPEGMAASGMEFLRICREEDFHDIVLSIKASNTVVMVKTVRLLVRIMEEEGMHYPLHLGVTEAGDGEDGRIKSAVGIGTLLAEGIGDTVRVSLSEEPEAELPVAAELVGYIRQREGLPVVKAKAFPGFDPLSPSRRKSRIIHNIGGDEVPVVISDRSEGDFETNASLPPDYIYAGCKTAENFPPSVPLIVDSRYWTGKENTSPCFSVSRIDELVACNAQLKFLRAACPEITDELMELLDADKKTVLILASNSVGMHRGAIHRLMAAGCGVPVVLFREYREEEAGSLQVKMGVDFGALLLDGFADGVMTLNHNGSVAASDNYLFGVLQAARVRISKTEYISCPGCGRTLFGLQATVARVKEATSHLKGLKIGIMGCIVNGPGEMADADYGYVGAGKGKVNLYKGKTCVMKNIPEDHAVECLVQLIKENGDWCNK